MAVAIVQDWVEEETDRSTKNYDAISARIMAQEEGPSGMLVHAAGFTGNGFRIFEVWESQADFDRFVEQTLMPILNEIGTPDDRQPEVTSYELHGFIAAPG
jgi:hypothetical protein